MLTDNFNKNHLARQKEGLLGKLKVTSLALACLATFLLLLHITNIKMVFGKSETGLWDKLPIWFGQVMFWLYPILLGSSFLFFILTRKLKSKLDIMLNILFLANGFLIILLLLFFTTGLAQNL